jgi:hypothetical protein
MAAKARPICGSATPFSHPASWSANVTEYWRTLHEGSSKPGQQA